MTEPTKTKLQKTQLTLPAEVTSAFIELDGDTDKRNEYATRLRELGWTLQSISEASGLTRERVRQIVAALQSDSEARTSNLTVASLPYPTPPERPRKAPREYVEPDPAKLARLLELQPMAQSVRSNSPKYRAEAEEYSALVAEVHLKDGVPLYRLSKRLSEQPEKYGKASHGALRFRLARYGYKLPAKGAGSKVYTPILAENRAGVASRP